LGLSSCFTWLGEDSWSPLMLCATSWCHGVYNLVAFSQDYLICVALSDEVQVHNWKLFRYVLPVLIIMACNEPWYRICNCATCCMLW
jgi:hypothetical protein